MPRIRSAIIAILLVVACSSGRQASAADWFASVEASLGRADQTLETNIGDVDFDPITAVHESVGLGVRYKRHFDSRLTLSWVQRGGQVTVRTVFRPDEHQTIQYLRNYIDVGTTCSYRFVSGRNFLALGLSPRLSILAVEGGSISASISPEDFLFGVDPFVHIGRDSFHVVARFLWDSGPTYKFGPTGSSTEMRDTVYFIGVGLDVG
jgi:hypothetical protein